MSDDRKDSTRDAYAKRVSQLWEAAAAELGCDQLMYKAFVDWLIEAKRPHLSPASWRQYRAAAVWALEQRSEEFCEEAKEVRDLIKKLKEAPPSYVRPIERRTSAQKAKKLAQNDFEKIVLTAHADGAVDAKALQVCLTSSRLSGLRPIEWGSARLVENPKPGIKWALIAACAKHDNERGHSETRTLLFETLPAFLERSLKIWLKMVGEAIEAGTFDRLRRALSSLMWRITRKVFRRRKKFPTLYSARHEAAGRWKYFYIEKQSSPKAKLDGAAIVAALLGHASDETSTQHYARAHRRSDGFPVPKADPEEVSRVRRRLAESLAKLAASRERETNSKPRI